MAFKQLRARVPRHKVAEIEALLELAGAASIALEDAEDSPLFEPRPGETPLWPAVALEALFPADVDANALQEMVVRALGEGEVTIERVTDEDLAARDAGPFAPLEIGSGLWLISADDAPPGPDAAVLRLHRGLAFGTGEHPTTALCLEWLASQLVPGSTVLDYGCGSGVLALAALKLDAARALLVDNDPQAVHAARANAELNGLLGQVWVGPPEALPAVRVDVVLANILARPLIGLAASFHERLVDGGRAILSGVLTAQRAELESAYAQRFVVDGCAERDGWIRLDTTKRAASARAS